MATMQDIADLVGVNRATVSNVLNGRLASTRRDAAARAREIRRVAEEIGYRPSQAARATRTGRTGFVGMICSARLSHSVHSASFNSGVDEALHQRGMCLLRDLIGDPLNPDDDGAAAPRIVREDAVDGLLVNYAFGTPPLVRDLIDRCQIPALWINRKRDANCVRPNDEGAAREATRHVLSFGHRRVAFLTVRPAPAHLAEDRHYSVADRQAGYAHEMIEAGLTPRVLSLPPHHPGEYEPGYIHRACLALLQDPDRPTAIVCGGDYGRPLVAAAWKLGLRVPEDLSVITFDNHAQADHNLAVDRVLVPYFPMGVAAVTELLALIDDPAEPRRPVVLPFEFHRTGSVSRPTPGPPA